MRSMVKTLVGAETDEALLALVSEMAQTECRTFCGIDTLPQECLPAAAAYAAALYCRYQNGEGEKQLKSLSRGDYTVSFTDAGGDALETLRRRLRPFRRMRF